MAPGDIVHALTAARLPGDPDCTTVPPYHCTTVPLHRLDYWAETTAAPGDIVHALPDRRRGPPRGGGGDPLGGVPLDGPPSQAPGCSGNCGPGECDVIGQTHGLLIVHPDALVSATAVGGSYQCLRRSALDAVLGGADASVHTLLGTVLHE
eukprot:1005926-Prorocentrum_minimum.AAC.1